MYADVNAYVIGRGTACQSQRSVGVLDQASSPNTFALTLPFSPPYPFAIPVPISLPVAFPNSIPVPLLSALTFTIRIGLGYDNGNEYGYGQVNGNVYGYESVYADGNVYVIGSGTEPEPEPEPEPEKCVCNACRVKIFLALTI